MNHFFTLLLAVSCLTAAGQDYEGLTVAFTTDSSIFLISEGQLSWDSAQAFAVSIGGHLATFSNPSENSQTVSSMTQNVGYWFGLRQDDCGVEPDQGWGWVTGESLTFTNWGGPEPNNVGGNEECAELAPVFGNWNDNVCSTLRYFVVELALQVGCTDHQACNFDAEANFGDDSCEYVCSGCTDSSACNYASDSNLDDGSCDYSCCPGPGCCHEGTIWDSNLHQCIVANPSDSNFDGCVQLNDLLDLLTAYGDCGAEESAWQCGDPLEYQGYDYETVQIGEQCWFAENVRILPEVSPPSVGSEQDEQPHAYVLGYDGNIVGDAMETDSYNYSGVLYNRACIENWQLCPTGWSVPSLSSFEVMIENLGGQDEAGNQLKATFPLWNGTAPSGFNLLAGGYRDVNSFDDDSYFYPHDAFVLANETFGGVAHYLHVNDWLSNAYLMNDNRHFGFSVRCIKDTE